MVADSASQLDGDTPAGRTSPGEAMTIGGLAECYCFEDLAKMARPLIRSHGLQAEVGAEDVANAVLYDLCMATAAGTTPELEPGGDSRKLARVLLAREVLDARRRVRSIKRGGSGRVEGHAGGDGRPASGRSLHRVAVDLDSLQAVGPAVEDFVIASMEEGRLIERLGNPVLKQIARMLVEERAVRDIAREIGQGAASIMRKIRQIRKIWRQSCLKC